MILKTERLALVSLNLEHLAATHAYSSDPEITKYMMFLPVESIEETRRLIEDSRRELEKDVPGYYEFAVLLDGVQIGGVNLYFDTAPDLGELGWIFLPESRGHGYATEAAQALIDWAHSALGIHRFIAHCDAENRASQGVMRRLGMALTDASGTRKNRGSDELRREYRYELAL